MTYVLFRYYICNNMNFDDLSDSAIIFFPTAADLEMAQKT